MSNPKLLIERLCLAIHGETPALVLEVLPSFVATLCANYGLSVAEFMVDLTRAVEADRADRALRGAAPPSAIARKPLPD